MDLPDALASLPSVDASEGAELIQEGSVPQRLFFLQTGKVEVLRDQVRVAVIKTPGSVLGELSILLDQPATATVRAMTDCVLREVVDPLPFLQSNPAILLHVSRGLAHRLDAASQYLVDVKEQLQECSDHVGMVDDVLDSIVHRDLKKKAAFPQ